MPSVYRALSVVGVDGQALRAAYAREFAGDELLTKWSEQRAPAMRTKASSIASGQRTAAKESLEKNEAYKAVDIFTRKLWYHNKNKHVLYDNAHQFANVLKQMMNAIKNRTKKDKLLFSNAIRERELGFGKQAHGRRTIVSYHPFIVPRPYNTRRV
jgi:hypothetical protein